MNEGRKTSFDPADGPVIGTCEHAITCSECKKVHECGCFAQHRIIVAYPWNFDIGQAVRNGTMKPGATMGLSDANVWMMCTEHYRRTAN